MNDLSKQRLKTWIRILGVTRHTESRLRDYLRREHGTTLPRFDVMAALWRCRDGVTMSELSRMLLVSNGNATAVVDRLEADGMAKREAEDGDRRRIRVRLTPTGLAAFEAMASGHEAQVDAIFANLTQTDLDTMRDILSRAKGAI
ncbi:MarR family winged helix-turn-helix transcriptional regulator [Paracoccus sp. JM45]|uniref:MarR family winged helix-turn-helix transcriptional regulator n=1 Tax=Paracoccus sp. JM45 TaxID=2283626 RepID=UPI000E6CEDD7|nr:MarR family transcriptional regulator [Paracoccus sp. JM45]RJE80792.1 MarR family transcriptional regulator [Paracoccus sp. JM45]